VALHLARRNRIARWFFVAGGCLIAAQGALAMLRGRPAYPNYWGGVVAPWFAIAGGIFIAVVSALFPRLVKKW
jgi:hypothetical protein